MWIFPTADRKLILLWTVLLIATTVIAADEDLKTSAHWRRPVALAMSSDALFVANRDSGTISVIDLKQQRVMREQKLGSRLADLSVIPGNPNNLLAYLREI
jgi:hypothetical protein